MNVLKRTQNRMTVAHTWYDRAINECDLSDDIVCAGTNTRSREAHGTEMALIRIASLCNRAEFKPKQVENIIVMDLSK